MWNKAMEKAYRKDEPGKDELPASPVKQRVMHDPNYFETQYMQKPVEQERCPNCGKPMIEKSSPRKGILFICKACKWRSA